MAKKINFVDGFQTGTVPTIGNIIASNLITYANDATYEATEQGAPAEGNIYFNTTSKLVRYYTGTAWVNIVDESSTQTMTNKTLDGTDATGTNTITNDATDVSFDNTTSGMSATDAQGAIDEVEGRVDTNEADIDDLETLSGSVGATDHGTFTGTTIPDSSTSKAALQSLETEVELKIDSTEKGAVNGVATLDGTGKLPEAQLPASVVGAVVYKGTWNASTNTPTLADGTGTQGHYYVTSVAGSVDLGSGSITYVIGDWVIHDGSTWAKVDTDDAVVSVFSRTGVVTAATNDYTWAQIDKTTSPINDLSDVVVTTPVNDQVLKYSSGNWVNAASPSSGLGNGSALMDNVGITSSAATGALTVTLTGYDGTALSGSNVATIAFRDTTATTGTLEQVEFDADESFVIASGSTLGYFAGDDCEVFIYALWNGTSKAVGVASIILDEQELHTVTIQSGSNADDSGPWSDLATGTFAVRLIGKSVVDSIATAGTWTAPDLVATAQLQSIDYKTTLIEATGTYSAYTVAASTWGDLTSISIPPGDWHVEASMEVNHTGTGTAGSMAMGIGTLSGTSTAGVIDGSTLTRCQVQATANLYNALHIQTVPITNTTTQNRYMKTFYGASTTNLSRAYKLTARRVKK